MVLKVAILDTNALENKGSYGRLVGLLRALDFTLPNHEVTVYHRYYDKAKKERIEDLKKYHPKVEIKRHPWYNEKGSLIATTMAYVTSFSACALKQAYNRIRSEKTSLFSDFDVIIDLNLIEPDRFNDKKIDLVNVFGQLFALLSIWNTALSNKEVIICSATIGPYKNPVLRFLAPRILNNVSLISLREEFSRDYLESIEVKRPKIQVTADLAFLMESDNKVDCNRVSSKVLDVEAGGNAIVGICPAAMMNSRLSEDEYIRLISDVSEFLIKDVGAKVLYIANTFQDVGLVEKIYQTVNNPGKSRIVPFSSSATETKAVIGLCDLFICSRFHALVASTSMGIPSIGLVSYSYNKFHGIIGKMMGQEEYLLDIDQTFDYGVFFKELRLKSEKILHDRESVRVNLLENCASTKKQALVNGYLIKDLVLANV
ncbi:polysaccharide pyruvyl transferase family protein [Methanosarcina mazei]|uniref:Polysaccharide pyruvyl transferase domain-containing protein n=1 Tax=Methanosarcina mazei TaxID=2209 RepID=A0A0F8BVE3_METMZ|nr:polysaccharide pyruvyl transferase family protein [Methanosarcina mazei]KKG07957.1 hypothetical protein DU34_16885 [Methanosarcina mazei]